MESVDGRVIECQQTLRVGGGGDPWTKSSANVSIQLRVHSAHWASIVDSCCLKVSGTNCLPSPPSQPSLALVQIRKNVEKQFNKFISARDLS